MLNQVAGLSGPFGSALFGLGHDADRKVAQLAAHKFVSGAAKPRLAQDATGKLILRDDRAQADLAELMTRRSSMAIQAVGIDPGRVASLGSLERALNS